MKPLLHPKGPYTTRLEPRGRSTRLVKEIVPTPPLMGFVKLNFD